jgi:hypothetical protein
MVWRIRIRRFPGVWSTREYHRSDVLGGKSDGVAADAGGVAIVGVWVRVLVVIIGDEDDDEEILAVVVYRGPRGCGANGQRWCARRRWMSWRTLARGNRNDTWRFPSFPAFHEIISDHVHAGGSETSGTADDVDDAVTTPFLLLGADVGTLIVLGVVVEVAASAWVLERPVLRKDALRVISAREVAGEVGPVGSRVGVGVVGGVSGEAPPTAWSSPRSSWIV